MNQAEILAKCNVRRLPFPMRQRQLEGITSFIEGNNVALFVPTGYGKTLVLKLAAKYLWDTYKKKTVLIGLLKALTSEQYEKIGKILPTIIDDGDHRDDPPDYSSEWAVVCMTPERFDSIMNNASKRDNVMADVGLIATDEAHTIGSASRGHRMENYIITTRILFPDLKYLYLSATVGNPKQFAKWLESDLVYAEANERPVPLQIIMKKYLEDVFPWNPDIPDFTANYKKRLEILRNLIRIEPKHKCWIIFVTSRARTREIACFLAGKKNWKYDKNTIIEDLVEEYGIAYHHGGMTKEERHYVENAFRSRKAKICIATPTLAVGVNLPADNCVIFDVEQYTAVAGNVPLDANRLQQTIGRAGRPTIKCPMCNHPVENNICIECKWVNVGKAIIITPDRLFEKMKDRAHNPVIVLSSLKERLHEKILQWICSGIAQNEYDITELCLASYADITEEETKRAINWLETFGFIKIEDDSMFKVTTIGYKTIQMYVMPETVVWWLGQIVNIKNPKDIYEIYKRFGMTPEYYGAVSIREGDGDTIEYAQMEIGKFFPFSTNKFKIRWCVTCNKQMECENRQYEMFDCTDFETCMPTFPTNELFKCFFLTFYDDLALKYLPKKWKTKKMYNPKTRKYEFKKVEEIKHIVISNGDKQTLQNIGERMFNAASVIFGKNQKLSDTLRMLSIMCKTRTLQKELVELCSLKNIGLKRAKKLFDSGITTIGIFLDSTYIDIVKALGCGRKTARKLIEVNQP